MNAIYDPPEAVAAWRKARGVKLGSSDTAAIMGLSPYRTEFEVYVEKVARLDNGFDAGTDATASFDITNPFHRGHLYEPLIARAYELRQGVKLDRAPATIHPTHDFIAASGDYVHADRRSIVELKKVHWRSADDWGPPDSDEIPGQYLVQAYHQMAVYGIDENNVTALIGDDDLRIYPLHRQPDVETLIIDALCDFWKRVLARTPPAPDWTHPATVEAIKRLHRPTLGLSIVLDDSCHEWIVERDAAAETIKAETKIKDEMTARLTLAMGEASLAHCKGYKITRTESDVKAYTTPARKQTVLRVSKPKGAK